MSTPAERSPWRFTVRSRMIAGLGAMVLITFALSAAAVLSFGDMERRFVSVAEDSLPAMRTAARLSQQSESILSQAPLLVAANSDIERQSVDYRIADQLSWLNEVIADLPETGADAKTTARIAELATDLRDRYAALSSLVAERLKLEGRLAEHSAALKDLGQDIQNHLAAVGDRSAKELTQMSVEPPGMWSRGLQEVVTEERAFQTWVLAGSAALSQVTAALSFTDPEALPGLRAQFNTDLSATLEALNLLPEPHRTDLATITDLMSELALGDTGVFDSRTALLQTTQAVQGTLAQNRRTADLLVAASSSVLNRIGDTMTESAEVTQRNVRTQTLLLMGFALASAVGAFALFLHLRSTILHRLDRLRESMVQQVNGGGTLAEDAGNDEIGDMAAALKHFVVTIDQREAALRASEAEMRAARHQAEDALVELRATQATLVQTEKMASLGQLVAGVAHEINTPLGTGITAATFLAQESRSMAAQIRDGQGLRKSALIEHLERSHETAELIFTNLNRAADLVQGFKQVAVDQATDERRTFELKPYLDEILMSLQPRLRKTAITVTITCPADVIMDTYPGALFRIVTNLVINALIHAYDEGQSGQITLTAHSKPEQGLVTLVFSDDGKGIPDNIQARVFDPFFTTNRGRGGTGLGLNIVFNLVTQMLGGTVTLESKQGAGTNFIMRLPTKAPEGKPAAETLDPPRQVAPQIL